MRRSVLLLTLLATGVTAGGCGRGGKSAPAPTPTITSARATFRTTDGRDVGSASLQQTAAGLLVTADLNGLPAGTHGIHFHSVGQCTAPDFTSAGPHHNPTAKQHGLRNAAGPHAGDLPNIHVPESGSLRVELISRDAVLGAGDGTLFDGDGGAIVIHALADDYQTDPSGGSGSRIACAVIER